MCKFSIAAANPHRPAMLLPAALAASLASAAGPASAFTVDSTFDPDFFIADGVCASPCTLREAIADANFNAGPDTIDFAIPGEGPHTIFTRFSGAIVSGPLTIDGYTQPGASENTRAVGSNAKLRIRIDGSNAGLGKTALNITANDCVVRGLSLTNFSTSAAIAISGADNTRIEGNFIGVSPGGAKPGQGNGWGVFLQSNFNNTADKPNGSSIGGFVPAERNLISGNSMGVEIHAGEGNRVFGNAIGTTRTGRGALGNTSGGVILSSPEGGNLIGGLGGGNVIAFNGGNGVAVRGFPASPGNRILRNSIFGNAALGIDLGADGVTPNDRGDSDAGDNALQNFPVLASAITSPGKTKVKGSLNSTPNTPFLLTFYSSPKADPSGFGEGKVLLGETMVETNAKGNDRFEFVSTLATKAGHVVTATATDSLGNTSEFSRARRIVNP